MAAQVIWRQRDGGGGDGYGEDGEAAGELGARILRQQFHCTVQMWIETTHAHTHTNTHTYTHTNTGTHITGTHTQAHTPLSFAGPCSTRGRVI